MLGATLHMCMATAATTAELATVNSPDIEHFGVQDNWEEWSACVDCTLQTIDRLTEQYA